MSKHFQPISHYPPHKRISDKKERYWKDSHSKLTKGSTQSRWGAEVVEEGAKASQIIMWLLYLCIKPETSKT